MELLRIRNSFKANNMLNSQSSQNINETLAINMFNYYQAHIETALFWLQKSTQLLSTQECLALLIVFHYEWIDWISNFINKRSQMKHFATIYLDLF